MISRRVTAGGRLEGSTLGTHPSRLYEGLAGEAFSRTLAALDLRTGERTWRLGLSENGVPVVRNGTGLLTAEVLSVSPDGALLYAWRATKDGVTGIAAIDIEARQAVAFSGPWNVAAGGLITSPSTPTHPTGLLAVLAGRNVGGPRVGEALYFLDATTLAPGVTSPDGATLYLRIGSPAIGPLFSIQPSRVIAIDGATRS